MFTGVEELAPLGRVWCLVHAGRKVNLIRRPLAGQIDWAVGVGVEGADDLPSAEDVGPGCGFRAESKMSLTIGSKCGSGLNFFGSSVGVRSPPQIGSSIIRSA
jgi:hypothetical protein